METRALVESIHAMNRRIDAVIKDGSETWDDAVRERAERAIHGDVYQAPDGAWTRIDFDRIDWDATSTVNPAHIVMVLRRFHMLGPLTAGYRATGDERYAKAARRYIEAFLRDHPPVENWTPVPLDADTQYDIRIGVWLNAMGHLRNSPSFDDAILAEMIKALRGNLRYLTTHVKPDRNIRFWHGLVLTQNGLRLSALPEAKAWIAQGGAILNDAVRRQVLADGAHMEATPGYHGGVMEIVEIAWLLSREFPELRLRVPTQALAAMHDYMLSATRPDGVTESLHDSRYPPAVAASRSTQTRDARAAFRLAAGLPDELPTRSMRFPDASQVFIRDDWSDASAFLTFDDATRRSFHWHPSRNSVTLFAHGRALLVDPGYTFASPDFPRYGHRTAHHNTMNFNGLDQTQSRAALSMNTSPDYTLVQGLYDGGYFPFENHSHGPGVFGEHHRTLLWLHRRFAVVIDHIHHTCGEHNKPMIESCWQLSEGPAECDAVKREVVTRHPRGNLLMRFPVVLDGTRLSMHVGEREPMRGWLPIEWGRRCIPAPLVRLSVPRFDPWNGDTATVLLPFEGPTPPKIVTEGVGPDATHDARLAGRVRITHENGTADVIVWTRRLQHGIGEQHDLNTNASLVHLRLDATGAVTAGLALDGTFCTHRGSDVMARLQTVDRLWRE